MSLTIEERTTSLVDFLVRLAGIVGGILVCSNYAWRGASIETVRPNMQLIPTFAACSRPRCRARSKETADRAGEQGRCLPRREGGLNTVPKPRKRSNPHRLSKFIPVGADSRKERRSECISSEVNCTYTIRKQCSRNTCLSFLLAKFRLLLRSRASLSSVMHHALLCSYTEAVECGVVSLKS